MSSQSSIRRGHLRLAGDDVSGPENAPFHLKFSDGFRAWLAQHQIGLAFSTYTAGKVVMIGHGNEGFAVSERTFDMAMAMASVPSGFLLSMRHQVWRFANSLDEGTRFDGWDRLYLPRQAHVTGAVDIHDLAIDKQDRLLAVVTGYNCVAKLDHNGSFTPIWRPDFIDQIVAEDRCHLNGFCLETGELAYITVIARSNEKDAWRDHRADGGQIIDARTQEVLTDGLAMPHSPRLHKGRLWVLEAGTGWLGWVDRDKRSFKRLAWSPGFVRGLRFIGDHAIVGVSKPRNKVFEGLPLDQELEARGQEPACGVRVIDLNTGDLVHTITITGSVEELYDVTTLPGATAPLLIGLKGEEIRKYVYIGRDG